MFYHWRERMSPISIGFVEQKAEGLFHFQKLQLRSGFRCVASATLCRPATAEDGISHLREVLDQPEIALVWMGARMGIFDLQSALEAGKHVLCGLPVTVAADDWRRLCQPRLDGDGPRVFVAALHRWENRFLTVQAQIGNGDLGPLIDLQRISRQYVPGELSRRPDPAGPLNESLADQPWIQAWETRTLQLKWFEILDELLLLVSCPVESVTARSIGDGRSIWVQFADGCRAHVELHRRSLAPLETGWILEGTTGGYADGRRFRAADDYELIDVPVDEVPTDQEAFYNSLEATLRGEAPFPVTNESILRVLTLRDAIETSLDTGQPVDMARA